MRCNCTTVTFFVQFPDGYSDTKTHLQALTALCTSQHTWGPYGLAPLSALSPPAGGALRSGPGDPPGAGSGSGTRRLLTAQQRLLRASSRALRPSARAGSAGAREAGRWAGRCTARWPRRAPWPRPRAVKAASLACRRSGPHLHRTHGHAREAPRRSERALALPRGAPHLKDGNTTERGAPARPPE